MPTASLLPILSSPKHQYSTRAQRDSRKRCPQQDIAVIAGPGGFSGLARLIRCLSLFVGICKYHLGALAAVICDKHVEAHSLLRGIDLNRQLIDVRVIGVAGLPLVDLFYGVDVVDCKLNNYTNC